MIMAWRYREGRRNVVFCNGGRVEDEEKRWGMKMGMAWSIHVDKRNHGYTLPD
jgi:hypothetical protein